MDLILIPGISENMSFIQILKEFFLYAGKKQLNIDILTLTIITMKKSTIFK